MSQTEELRAPYGWTGTVADFLATKPTSVLESLSEHHGALYRREASESQLLAWRNELADLASAFDAAVQAEPSATDWEVVLEFELVFEGGRRPDVIVLAGQTIAVCEFKGADLVAGAQLDQVLGYARDLRESHDESANQRVEPVLVAGRGGQRAGGQRDGVHVVSSDGLSELLLELAEGDQRPRHAWLAGRYAPLPSLVQAAKRLFNHLPVPHVRRALFSAHVPETVDLATSLVAGARTSGDRRLVLITGSPGAGKTLVGLRIVYEGSEGTEATFLSGNGPLVTVLRDALGSGVFVKDLHKFVGSYSRTTRIPSQHILVFDEAQRAWDREIMSIKKGVDASEPQLLVEIADNLPDYACIVGLIGTGQEIFSGEEGGLGQWRDALVESSNDWAVHCPPELASTFQGVDTTTHDLLRLDVSLRSRRAERLHEWVASLLDHDLDTAAQYAADMDGDEFDLYLTRDLDDARGYANDRYDGEFDSRFGLVASSAAKALPSFGVDNTFIATSRMKLGRWYNAPRDDELSCCALDQPVTEFGCQGLELDLPIVCWGEDILAAGGGWELKPARRRIPLRDPEEILRNAYRVLLTRGRDGVVMWVPPDGGFDATADALAEAGVSALPV